MAHRVLRALSLVAAGLAATAGADGPAGAPTPQDASYLIEGETLTLVDGVAEQTLVPGAASKQLTRYVGPAVELDLDRDGMADAGFLLLRDSGGSGTFYYVAAALLTADGYRGTNALFLGDRIAPLEVFVDPQDPARFIVSYATRGAAEPMSAVPTERVAKTFHLERGTLVELAETPAHEQ